MLMCTFITRKHLRQMTKNGTVPDHNREEHSKCACVHVCAMERTRTHEHFCF